MHGESNFLKLQNIKKNKKNIGMSLTTKYHYFRFPQLQYVMENKNRRKTGQKSTQLIVCLSYFAKKEWLGWVNSLD